MMLKAGLDIGSTTIKCIVLGENDEVIYKTYQRHFAKILEAAVKILTELSEMFPGEKFSMSISGSAGMGLAEVLDLPFVQEVAATDKALKKFLPDTDIAIELGGEDSKILFLSGNHEIRMNGSCAGGTGSFIDQMVSLLNVSAEDFNTLSSESTKNYNIASRCGVFAKTDVQSLLNQGAAKSDICASVFYAVANQAVTSLAQGRKIHGKLVYLGGPLTFMPELRRIFDKVLNTKGFCPELSLYYVALGTALNENSAQKDMNELLEILKTNPSLSSCDTCLPLFSSEDDYKEFQKRHAAASQIERTGNVLPDSAFIGIDSGSTTVKFVAIDENEKIFFKKYLSNKGEPVNTVKECLCEFYEKYPDILIKAAASTGYGEELMKIAFKLDQGLVETIAHMYGAKKFDPNVDFIIDIGGQDIKCLKINGDHIDNIFLNEACSSGCGSFLQTFADALGYTPKQFADLALFSKAPVDLGSRCTVFMNSSVKHAQKCGASVEDIAAGLAVSVVKNALYKVIRNRSFLGSHIVVQGGTFLNDAVLRSFENETGKNVTRPPQSALMGAYGAALYAKTLGLSKSSILSRKELENFRHEIKNTVCSGCGNKCKLSINSFGNGKSYISGNKCDRLNNPNLKTREMNMYKYKRELIAAYSSPLDLDKPTIGLPRGLNMYELFPFWYTLFTSLGFNVVTNTRADRNTYIKGQNSVPSETVCYPAKLMHGLVKELADNFKADYIFYPCMTYNVSEAKGFKNYNCPVVAYYPEVIKGNLEFEGSEGEDRESESNQLDLLNQPKIITDCAGLHNKLAFPEKMRMILKKNGLTFTFSQMKRASKAAYLEQDNFRNRIIEKANEWLEYAKNTKTPVVLLASRPYHTDIEINHSLDQLITESGCILISEDSLAQKPLSGKLKVLNQWTYHSRMYNAANFVISQKDLDINLIQLVSFGCGLDAITSDEVKRIIESGGKIYTQIKIDEIANLGAASIRLKSLYAADNIRKRGNSNEGFIE